MGLLRLVTMAASTVVVFSATAAERETLSIGRAIPDSRLVQEFLFPEAHCENTAYQCMSVRPSGDRAIGMDVRFPTSSAELTPSARAQLDPLGKVLAARSGKLNPGEIVIEGHADARGSADLNKKLSQERAAAVVKHLVAAYKIDPKALQPVGRGKEQLRDPSRPESEVNRRVEMVRKAN